MLRVNCWVLPEHTTERVYISRKRASHTISRFFTNEETALEFINNMLGVAFDENLRGMSIMSVPEDHVDNVAPLNNLDDQAAGFSEEKTDPSRRTYRCYYWD